MIPARTRRRAPRSLTMLVVALAAGCGGGPPGGLSDEAHRGWEVADASGCFACHGKGGEGAGIAPGWVGLAGSTVTLDDGSEVVADTDYLRRAISDPGAEVVAGYGISMPRNRLSDTEIDAVVAYIEELR